mgnify:CR=1 FL=1
MYILPRTRCIKKIEFGKGYFSVDDNDEMVVMSWKDSSIENNFRRLEIYNMYQYILYHIFLYQYLVYRIFLYAWDLRWSRAAINKIVAVSVIQTGRRHHRRKNINTLSFAQIISPAVASGSFVLYFFTIFL